MTNIPKLPNLLACPYCNELPVYSHGDYQHPPSIRCSYCPLMVEGMPLERLVTVWNELPRFPNRHTGGPL